MEKESKYKEEDKEEAKFLSSVKSKTGTLLSCLSIGFCLGFMVIVLPIPVCSYNPTVLDDLKREVTFFDLSSGSVEVMILYVGSFFFMYGYASFLIVRGRWRRLTEAKLFFALFFVVTACLSVAVLYTCCDSYEIPQSQFKNAPIKYEAGFYLFAAGAIVMAICMTSFMGFLDSLAKGRMSLEDLKWKKASGSVQNTVNKQEVFTFAEKMEELNKLKNEGLITEEEFTQKKEELLKNYR